MDLKQEVSAKQSSSRHGARGARGATVRGVCGQAAGRGACAFRREGVCVSCLGKEEGGGVGVMGRACAVGGAPQRRVLSAEAGASGNTNRCAATARRLSPATAQPLSALIGAACGSRWVVRLCCAAVRAAVRLCGCAAVRAAVRLCGSEGRVQDGCRTGAGRVQDGCRMGAGR